MISIDVKERIEKKYVMRIHLLAGIMMSTIFIHNALFQNKIFQVCPYFFFLGCFFPPARYFSVSRSFQEDLSPLLARVSGSAVISNFKFLDARDLIKFMFNIRIYCSQRCQAHSIQTILAWNIVVFSQIEKNKKEQKKLRWILGAFIVPLKSRLIFNIFYCLWMFVNKLFTYLTWAYLKK